MSPRLYVLTCECGKYLTIDESQVGQAPQCPQCGRNVIADAKTVIPMGDQPSPEDEARLGTQVGEDGVPVDWKVGDVILNLYEISDVLGEGGMGKVFKVHHRGWNMPLAVKSPKARTLLKRDGAANFEHECETWVNLGLHPNIVSCYYVRRLGGIPRVFAEFVDGGSLWHFIEEGKIYKGGPQKAVGRICDIGIQIAWGLQHAHDRGLVHQDVKPANVLITREAAAKVTDFGLARAHALAASAVGEIGGDERVTNVGMTRIYCSPEQANREKLTVKTDMWSWALCILEAYTVKVIWRKGTEGPDVLKHFLEQSKTNTRLLPMPPIVADLLERCLRVDPETRPRDMNEIASTLVEAYRQVMGEPYPRPRPKPAKALADSLNNRAVSLMDLSKGVHAEGTWERALKTDPHHPESTYNLCMTRWRTGRMTDEAVVGRLKEIVKFHPGEWIPFYALALAHMEQCLFTEAGKILGRAASTAHDRKEVAVAIKTARRHAGETRKLTRILDGHHDSISAAAISRDGTLILSGSEDNTLKLWELEAGTCVRTLEGHQNTVTSVTFNLDGTRALSGSRDRTIRYWNVITGETLLVLEGHRDTITAVCLTGDDRKALSASADGSIRLWDLHDGTCLDVFEEHRGPVPALAMDWGGLAAVSGGQDGVIRVWDVAGHRCTHVMAEHHEAVTSLALSEDGRFAVSGSRDGSIKVWHPAAGKCLATGMGHQGPVRSVSMSRDGRFAVSGSRDGTVRFWDTGEGRCLNTFRDHDSPVSAVALSPDARYAASGGADRRLRLWFTGTPKDDTKAQTLICQAVASEVAISTSKAFDDALESANKAMANGNVLEAAYHLRTARAQPGHRRTPEAIHEWRALYTRLPRVGFNGAWEETCLSDEIGPLKSVSVSTNGRRALVVDPDSALAMWDLARADCSVVFERDSGSVECACISESGKVVLTGGWEIKLWDAKKGTLLRAFERQVDVVNAIDLTFDEDYAVTASGRAVKIWDVDSGRCIGTLLGHSADVNAVKWSPDERLVLSAGEDKTVQVWEVRTGKCLLTLTGHAQPIRCLSCSLDGRYVSSGSGTIWGRPGELKVWDLASGACLQSFEGHTDTVQSVSISGDSRYLLSGSRDKSVRLWNLHTGQLVHSFGGHNESIERVRLSLDGRFAVSAGKDGVIRLWALDWELEDRPPGPWHPGATPYLENFLVHATPYSAQVPSQGAVGQRRIRRALTRHGAPRWEDADLAKLWHLLGCGGYGWIETEDVLAQLQRVSARWRVPTGLPAAPEEPSGGGGLARKLLGRFT